MGHRQNIDGWHLRPAFLGKLSSLASNLSKVPHQKIMLYGGISE